MPVAAPTENAPPPPLRYENVLWLDAHLEGDSVAPPPSSTSSSTFSSTEASADEAARQTGWGAPSGALGPVSLFVSGEDRYIDGSIIHADAVLEGERRTRQADGRPARELRSVLWEDEEHGGWLRNPQRRQQVIRSVLFMPSEKMQLNAAAFESAVFRAA